MKRIAVALLAAAGLAAPASASAGVYHVYACTAGGKAWPNGSWTTRSATGVSVDANCNGGVAASAAAGATVASNTAGGLVFASPSGTSIVGFTLTRRLDYVDTAPSGTHQLYATYHYGSTVFAGAGDYDDPTRNNLNKQKHWYGYPAGTAHVALAPVTMATFPALAGMAGRSNQLSILVGCFPRGNPPTNCSIAAGGGVTHRLTGADVAVNDPTPPSAMTVEASGLLSGGSRDGSDPVTVTAADNAGIRRVELIDITNPFSASIVGSEDYGSVPTDGQKACDYSLRAPCPNLARETIRATSLQVGQRQVVVRVTDTGGNVVDRGPYTVSVITPSNRGPANGANATDSATLQVRFTTTTHTRRLVGYGDHVGVRGRLLNSSGQPVAGAEVKLLTRDLRQGATVVVRRTLRTGADGRFRTTVAATASRLLQVGWLSHVYDVRFAASSYLTLEARASARLGVSTRRPRVGRGMTISGRLRGVSRGGVTVILQGRARGSRHYDTFADTTATRTGAFRVRYRFRNGSSRGRSFVLRAKIRPGARFPYRTGYSNRVTVRVR